MKKFSVINQRFNFNHLQGFPSINEENINKHNYSFHNTNNKIDFEKTYSESLIADISPVEHEIIAKQATNVIKPRITMIFVSSSSSQEKCDGLFSFIVETEYSPLYSGLPLYTLSERFNTTLSFVASASSSIWQLIPIYEPVFLSQLFTD